MFQKGKRLSGIEFQLREKVLRDLKIKNIDDLFQKIDGAWALLHKEMVEVSRSTGLHHTNGPPSIGMKKFKMALQVFKVQNLLLEKKAVRIDKKRYCNK